MFHRSLYLPAIFFAVACVVNVGGPAGALVPDEPSVASNGTSGAGAFLAFQKPAMLLAQRGKGKRRRSGGRKRKMDAGGFSPVSEPCPKCEDLEGFVSPGEIDDKIRKMVGKY